MIIILITVSVTLVTTLGIVFISFYRYINQLWTIGPLYWITRDNTSLQSPIVAVGFMRQTNHPWKTGKGLQIRINRYALQVGICKKTQPINETNGILGAIGGRIMEEDTSTIRNWR